jgi:hypothetical protein
MRAMAGPTDYASDTRLPVSRLASPLDSLPARSELKVAYLLDQCPPYRSNKRNRTPLRLFYGIVVE